jgi:predicted RNA-binding protein
MLELKDARKLNPGLNPELFLPSPRDVLEAMDKKPVKDWLSFIAAQHVAPRRKLLLFIPCAEKKPYYPPRDELHERLLELERKYGVYLCSVSEPLALEPREFWSFKWKGENLVYDAPFFPWIEKYGYKWDSKLAAQVWRRLSRVVHRWFSRNRGNFQHVLALACPGSGYRRILSRIEVEKFIPEKCPDIEATYEENVSRIYTHPAVWSELEEKLKEIFGE